MKACCREYLIGQFGDDEDVLNEIYAEYARSLAEKIAEIETALGAGDFTTVDRSAHAVKGNSLAAGDPDVAAVAIKLRQTAKLQEKGESEDLLAKLKEFLAQL